MSDFLNSQILVNFVRETPPESLKLMNVTKKQISSSFESGEKVLQSGEGMVNVIGSSTNIYIVSEKNIKITLSNGYEFEKMKQFAYAGESPVSVTITNETQTTNRVVYAAGKVLNKE